MSRRRISHRSAGSIADERMTKLFAMSRTAVRNGNEDRAKRYVFLARRIGQKTNRPIPEGDEFCKDCGLPMIHGVNCRARVGDGRLKVTCLNCGWVKRMPYTKEQRK